MTHILPPHSDLNLSHSSLQTALQIDPNQPQQQQQQAPPAPGTGRKRKKAAENGEDSGPAEPRRLRRSHEACARCRSKKIKCDSKYPRCTACANAGTPCQQEDRHRQTLTPRGHTERIERQLVQCEALLKRHVPGFDMNNLDEILAREGLDVEPTNMNMNPSFQFIPPRSFPGGPSTIPPKGFAYPPQHMLPPGYPPMQMYGGPPGSPFPPPPMGMQGPPPHYNPHMHPFPHSHMGPPQPVPVQQRPPSAGDQLKGTDPQANDLSTSESLAKSFGVSAAIVNDLKLSPAAVDREDLAVGSSGLSSRRDLNLSAPRDERKWLVVTIRLDGDPPQQYGAKMGSEDNIDVLLPRDRDMVKRIVAVYFERLNYHRPVFFRGEFERTLNTLYEGKINHYDPGFICALYLVLALGTLSELNHRVFQHDNGGKTPTQHSTKDLMGATWPDHEEFFECALIVKPELRVTASSLQALILLHWYLYTERQGRTLWRLVGSLVRLGIELGLHHDPTSQGTTFSEEECQLRIRLWNVILMHDRGTSILLGRPLAIAPSDSNTPAPTRIKGAKFDISEHYLISNPLAEIQADIINSLYNPGPQSGESLLRHAIRIIKSMVAYRAKLPDSYKAIFGGTEDWPLEKKLKHVQDITEDQGLTFLKIGISRILLLRALFSSTQLEYGQRHKALEDAIVTSHNIIVVHNQLIRFPDIAFFVSPIPLHIAAMVILYGHMSHCERIPRQVALEDIWMALDVLPSLRWRWERKDLNGGHPLIAKVAEKVLDVNLHQVGPPSHPTLLNELEWEQDAMKMANAEAGAGFQPVKTQQATPKMDPSVSSGLNYPTGYSVPSKKQHQPQHQQSQQQQQHLADVPPGLFFPFYPDKTSGQSNDAESGSTVGSNGEFNHLLAAAAQPMGNYSYHSGQESYMLEEKDPVAIHPAMQMWVNNGSVPRAVSRQKGQGQPPFKYSG